MSIFWKIYLLGGLNPFYAGAINNSNQFVYGLAELVTNVPLYFDMGGGYNIPLGVKGGVGPVDGVFLSPSGVYTYGGVSLSSGPGPSLSASIGFGSVTEGTSTGYAIAAIPTNIPGMLLGGQLGSGFLEISLSTPGVSITTIETEQTVSFTEKVYNFFQGLRLLEYLVTGK